MYDNYNYPMGADTPSAPWNQSDPDPIEKEIDVYVTVKRTMTLETEEYYYDGEDDGKLVIEADWSREYKDQCATIDKLLKELVKYIDGELAGGELSYQRRRELEEMRHDAEDWELDFVETDY